MSIESVNWITDLDPTNPKGGDQRSTADDHIRAIKLAISKCWVFNAASFNQPISISAADMNLIATSSAWQNKGNLYAMVGMSSRGGLQAAVNAKAKRGTEAIPKAKEAGHRHWPVFRSASAAVVEFAEADQQNIVYQIGASAVGMRIPAFVSVSFSIGCDIEVIRAGSGTFDISPGAGVVIYNSGAAGAFHVSPQYGNVIMRQVWTNTWVVSGDAVDGAA